MSKRAGHFKRLTTRIFQASGLLPVAVMADGNCGAWSLMDLISCAEGKTSCESILCKDPLGAGLAKLRLH